MPDGGVSEITKRGENSDVLPAESVAALDRAIELYPDSLPSRAGRAVLLARKGDRPSAHRDAEHCLGQNPGADIVYQLAGAFALTSKEKPEDAQVALRLLTDALSRGYGFSLLAIDSGADLLQGFHFAAPSATLPDDPLTKRILTELLRMRGGATLAAVGVPVGVD